VRVKSTKNENKKLLTFKSPSAIKVNFYTMANRLAVIHQLIYLGILLSSCKVNFSNYTALQQENEIVIKSYPMMNNLLKAAVISTSPYVSLVSCSVACNGVANCAYIGINTVSKTCTLLSVKRGFPSKFTTFTEVYIVESRTAKVCPI
jgi:hypothetical protein